MTRALLIALVFAATLGAIVVGFLAFLPNGHRRRPHAPPEAGRRLTAPPVRVLAGETAARAIVLKERHVDPKRAEFSDRALAEAVGARPGDWSFVEVWTVVRDPNVPPEGGPVVRSRDGGPTPLKMLAEILPEGATPTPRAKMLVAAWSAERVQLHPPGKGTFRKDVYALPASQPFADLVSADVDGIHLEPRETTAGALESFFERPKPDLLAALGKRDESPETRTRAEAASEEPR